MITVTQLLRAGNPIVIYSKLSSPVLDTPIVTFNPLPEVQVTFNNISRKSVNYEIQGAFGTGEFQTLGLSSDRSYVDSAITLSGTYSYRVRALYSILGSRQSDWSNTVSVDIDTLPLPPTGLSVAGISSNSTRLTWVPSTEKPTDSQTVEYSGGGVNNFTGLITLASTGNLYFHTGLQPSTRYAYRIYSTFVGQNSQFSNTGVVITDADNNPPSAPSGLTTSVVGSTSINLNWIDTANNEERYIAERGPTSTGTWTVMSSGISANSTSYSAVGLTASTSYFFRLKANNQAGDSSYSNLASGTTLASDPTGAAPAAASNVTADQISSSSARINWNRQSTNEYGFYIELSPDGASWHEIKQVPSGRTSYVLRDLYPSRRYSARIRSYNSFGISETTPTVIFNTSGVIASGLPMTPSGLMATAQSPTSMFLNWNITDDGTMDDTRATSFVVQRSASGAGSWGNNVTVGPYWTECVVTGLSFDTAYDFRIAEVNSVGTGSFSNTATGRTLASGLTWSGLSRDPRTLSPRWYLNFKAGQANYNANPTNPTSFAGQVYKSLKSRADTINTASEPYLGATLAALLIYVLTGDTTYASKAWIETNSGNPALTNPFPYLGRTVTVVNNDSSATTTSFKVTPALVTVPQVNFAHAKFWFNTGQNADTSLKHFRIASYSTNGSVTTITIVTDASAGSANILPFIPEHGDELTILRPLDFFGNALRESMISWSQWLDLFWSYLSDAQRTKMIQWLVEFGEIVTNINQQTYVGGTSAADSDQNSGVTLGVAMLEALLEEDNHPRSGEFISRMGSLVATGIGFLTPQTPPRGAETQRAAIAAYGATAHGGCWIESLAYDHGTIHLVTEGRTYNYRLYGQDYFPELGPIVRNGPRYLYNAYAPNLTFVAQWGDTEHPNVHPASNDLGVLGEYQGANAGVYPWNGYLTYLAQRRYALNNVPYPIFYTLFDPTVSGINFQRERSRNFQGASPRFCQYHVDGTGDTDSLYANRSFSFFGVHHSGPGLQCAELYRKGERVIINNRAYSTWSTYEYALNGMLQSNLQNSTVCKGPINAEVIQDSHAYMNSSTRGAHYVGYYNPPPTYQHEWTRSAVYFPSSGVKNCDTLVVYDRTNLADPRQLPSINRYSAGGLFYPPNFIVSGVATTTVIPCNLPTGIVNRYRNHGIYVFSGPSNSGLAGIQSSTTVSGVTQLTLKSPLVAVPNSGDSFQHFVNGDLLSIIGTKALEELRFNTSTLATFNDGRTDWSTTGGQEVSVRHLLPTGINRILYDKNNSGLVASGHFLGLTAEETFSQFGLTHSQPFPNGSNPRFATWLNVWVVNDPGQSITTTLVQDSGKAEGVLLDRKNNNNIVAVFCGRPQGRTHWDGYSISFNQTTNASKVFLFDMETSINWTRNLDSAGATGFIVSKNGVGIIEVTGIGSHTLVLATGS